MPHTLKAFGTNYSRGETDTLDFFLKRNNLLEDLLPLHSKARSNATQKLVTEAMKHWLVPTELIREYYGDNVTMYFSWMNFLISKYLFLLPL